MYEKEKKEIIYWAKKLNEKGFVTARSGNISLKVDKGLLITSHDCYLGELQEEDILLVDSKGNILEGRGEITSEKELHLGIHNNFAEVKVVLHAHPPYTVAFFHYFDKLEVFSFEARFYLGTLKPIPQQTPTVTQIEPVLRGLENSDIVILAQHGVVSIGGDFKSAFSLIELLEEQAKVNLLLNSKVNGSFSKLSFSSVEESVQNSRQIISPQEGRYKLLSKEHIERLVELVNNDKEVQELGKNCGLTCTLAVKNQDSGECACFYYKEGKIVKTDGNENAEFLISGRADILRKIFNRQIDPFVALTQGKVKTKGDFSKMSKWYPVLVHTFRLWEQAPVE